MPQVAQKLWRPNAVLGTRFGRDENEDEIRHLHPVAKPIGALIFLSGLTCTDENFMAKAGAQRALEEGALMVICPDTSPRGTSLPHEHESYDFGSGAGFYVDATTDGYRDHYRMYSYVTKELYGLVQREFRQSRISVSGHSMGSHGALVMALHEPQKFCSVSAFSPIVNPTRAAWGQKALAGYLGEAGGADSDAFIAEHIGFHAAAISGAALFGCD